MLSRRYLNKWINSRAYSINFWGLSYVAARMIAEALVDSVPPADRNAWLNSNLDDLKKQIKIWVLERAKAIRELDRIAKKLEKMEVRLLSDHLPQVAAEIRADLQQNNNLSTVERETIYDWFKKGLDEIYISRMKHGMTRKSLRH